MLLVQVQVPSFCRRFCGAGIYKLCEAPTNISISLHSILKTNRANWKNKSPKCSKYLFRGFCCIYLSGSPKLARIPLFGVLGAPHRHCLGNCFWRLAQLLSFHPLSCSCLVPNSNLVSNSSLCTSLSLTIAYVLVRCNLGKTPERNDSKPNAKYS
jgi:hypothetical protein